MNQIEKETPVRSNAGNDQRQRCWRRRARAGLLALVGGCALLAGVGVAPAMASGPFGVAGFSNAVLNADGTPATQAGSHPYEMVTSVAFSGADNVKDVVVGLPPGLIGNPNAVPRCPISELSNGTCSAASEVGALTITGPSLSFTEPLYNLVSPTGQPAQFGANILLANSFLDITVRTGSDYGLTTTSANVSPLLGVLTGIQVTLWGVPAELNGSGAPDTPLLTLPTSCTGPLTSTLSADPWDHPGQYLTATSVIPGMTGCDRLAFSPSISVQPDTTVADSPAGLNVDVHVPQAPDDANALATSDLQNATVTLPSGMAVNPAAADGLQACSEAQFGLDNGSEPTCPTASTIGSAEIDSPIQADPLVGSIYLAQQNSNPFGSLLAIYVAVQSDGVLIKLAGELVADPVTGQLTTMFPNSPQLPFTEFKLDFFGGNRAVLVTPDSCGAYTATSSLAPWSGGAAATPSDSFTIGSGCVSGFSPSFLAGVSDPQAGAYTPFGLSFSRSDTDQELSGLTVVLPPGMLASLGNVPLCPDANASAGTCPASSQVGTAEVGAGAGSDPFFVPGNVYLTGPYNGGQYGLAVVVPVIAGPLNLGTVVVRESIRVDPTTAQVTVVSDPLPTILDGIPLRVRRVDVTLNRPNFTVAPTSCDPMQVTGTLTSTGGITVPVSSPFQVGGCQALGFSPKLKLALSGKGKTKSGDHPTLTATLTQPGGQANIHSAQVTLPLSLALDPTNSKNVCPYATAQAVHGGAVGCPASTIVGSATAVTPLLSQPLTSPVYLVQGIRFGPQGQQIRTLPSLLVPLRGQISLDLRATTSVNGLSELVTTFASIPDTAVSSFTLTITGGPKGLLVITGRGLNICKSAQVAGANLDAQSGKNAGTSITMTKPCGGSAHSKRHNKRHNKRRQHAARTGAARLERLRL